MNGTPQPLVIGIIGKKGSGKDTMADRIIQMCGSDQVVKYSLATPIKEVCKILFRLTDGQLHNEVEKELPDPRWANQTPRRLMQWIGTDVFRNQFGTDFWLQHARWAVDTLVRSYRIIIIPDVRFTNEAEFVRSYPNHLLVRIHRDTPLDADSHSSETDLEKIPMDWVGVTIQNQSTLSNFDKDIHHMARHHLLRHLVEPKKNIFPIQKSNDPERPPGTRTESPVPLD